MQVLVILLSVVTLSAIGALFWFVLRREQKPKSDGLQLLHQQMGQLQEQLRASLEGSTAQIIKTHETVGSRLDNAARVVGELHQRMGKVEEATRKVFEVGSDIASLQEILRAPKLRGNLGEHFLGDLLAQMLPQEAYSLQYEFKSGERVDAVIHTAHGLVPTDAKFPLENFQRMLTAKTDEERRPWRKQFITDVRKHVDDIATKYIRPGEGTFDFALMYIPAENVYYEIIARDEAANESTPIAAHAMKKRVIPVSPNTFYAYLNTILLGLRGMRVERFASEILKDLGRIRREVGTFTDEFGLIGKHLSNATNTFAKAEKRLNRIDDRLTSFESPEALPEERPLIPS